MSERKLKFEVIWKDEHMFEMRVAVNNGCFSGITEVYEVSKSLLGFVNELKEFPFKKDNVSHFCGEKDGFSFFEMEFYKIGLTGICGVLITMEGNVASDYRKQEKEKLSLELIIEPNSIGVFCKELKSLAEKEAGIAELKGIEKHMSSII